MPKAIVQIRIRERGHRRTRGGAGSASTRPAPGVAAAIVAAALDLLAEVGFARLTMDQVAARAMRAAVAPSGGPTR